MEARLAHWLSRDPDPVTRAELEALIKAQDQAELARRFKGRLEFGTAGLRGTLGAGPSRMNRLVIRETSAGLGAYLKTTVANAEERGVVLAYDGRRLSKEFAHDTASVLAAMGFRVYIYKDVAPTPLGAFAVRTLKAAAGVVVTASHNPPEYNGYKVYWENGAQIIPPHDRGIAAAIDAASQAPLPFVEFGVAEADGRIQRLGNEMLATYLKGVAELSVREPTAARQHYPVAYTPLHGVGAKVAEAALAQAGFKNVRMVAAQREPDGGFPTVRFPNPEEPGAMDMVMALAAEMGADLAVANDPDADRFAAAARLPTGAYRRLHGDQIGALLGAEMLTGAPQTVWWVSTVVSSRLLGAMARAKGLAFRETLTGFKWIANAGFAAEAQGHTFVFGYEEALGYTIGGLVRDKDGISALVAFLELACTLKNQGQTVLDRLLELYQNYGLYWSGQRTLALDPDRKGPSLGERLRNKPPRAIAGRAIVSVTDLQVGSRHFADGRTEKVELPPSDVLTFELDDRARVIVRPSGTEPKIKCYYEVILPLIKGSTYLQAEAQGQTAVDQLAEAHQRELTALG